MRNIVLSKRMEAVVNMVSPQSFTVADVGCDHAYVSIALIKRELAKRVIAMDVKNGPLEIAKANIEDQKLSDKIELRMGDGLEKLLPGEADSIIIAGMGGLLMKRILSEGSLVLDYCKKRPELVLQPQSDLPDVRIFLQKHSYHIVQEKMLIEDEKYYTVLKALPGEEAEAYNPVELLYGKVNLENRDSVLYTYLEKERQILDKIEGQLNGAADEMTVSNRSMERVKEIGEQKRNNERARQYYGEG